MNFFDHKDLENHLLQLCPKAVKHPVYIMVSQQEMSMGVHIIGHFKKKVHIPRVCGVDGARVDKRKSEYTRRNARSHFLDGAALVNKCEGSSLH